MSQFTVSAAPTPKNLLLIHEVLPHYDCSGSDLRLMEVIREILAQGHRLAYLARNARNFAKYAPQLQALGVSVLADDPDRMRHIGDDRQTTWSLRALLEGARFDAAILFHWFWSGTSIPEDYLHDIRTYAPATRIVVLTDDRHGERERRLAKLSGSLADFERGNGFEARELEVYQQADLVLFISEADRRHFLALCPHLETELLPMAAEIPPAGPDYSERTGVLFLGNFENLANRDALDWFLAAVWPLVLREEPALQLSIAGNAAPKELQAKHRHVTCLGRVADLAPLLTESRVFAAPIRYGTGINTKNLQAMAHGLPVVTTSVGAEGLQLRDGVDALIADTPEAFAEKLLRLWREPELWSAIARGARKTVERQFSQATFREQVRGALARAAELPAKPQPPGHSWSYRRVEATNPEVLSQRPAKYRTLLRVIALWQAGRQLLADGQAAAALEQFRHLFAALRGSLAGTIIYSQLLGDMAQAYRELHDEERTQICKDERSRASSPAIGEAAAGNQQSATHDHATGAALEFSLIIPTHNRYETLRLCLAALAFQSLPADRWEIVVIDDGSTDATSAFCRNYVSPNANFRYFRQANAGAGAARRAGVEAARGEYVLLMNDDTVPQSALLAEHLKMHREKQSGKWAVLGAFHPSDESLRQPLSCWINRSSFLFPQNSLRRGGYGESAYFITCNLSLRRTALLEAGNFDPQFRVAEDTELGARLVQRGYRVWFHPEAHAWHEHGDFTLNDLLRRARLYGEADWKLFQKHPHLLGTGSGPFGLLRDTDITHLKDGIARNREAVAVACTALEKAQDINMVPLFTKRADGTSPAEELWQQLAKVVPLVYWQYLFESFLAAREKDLSEARHEMNSATRLVGA